MNWKSLHPLLLSINLTSEYHEGNTIEERYLILGRRNIGDWVVKKDSGKGYERRWNEALGQLDSTFLGRDVGAGKLIDEQFKDTKDSLWDSVKLDVRLEHAGSKWSVLYKPGRCRLVSVEARR